MELNAAGILAALAAAVFAAQSWRNRASVALLLVSFAGTVVAFAGSRFFDAATLGYCIVGAAVASLARPRWWLLPPVAAGICGAAWVSILGGQGLPWAPAIVIAAAVLAASAGGARRRGFLSNEVRDEALVIVAAFALLLAVGPAVVDGWRSSITLAAEPLGAAGPEFGPWLGAIVAVSLLLGGAYSIWKRR